MTRHKIPYGVPAPILCKALGIPLWALKLARRVSPLPSGQHTIRLVVSEDGDRQIQVNGGRRETLTESQETESDPRQQAQDLARSINRGTY